MAATKKQPKKPAATPKPKATPAPRKATPPTPKPPAARPDALAASVGQRLGELLKKTGPFGTHDALSVLGQMLVRGDEFEHKPLVKLRDMVKEVSKQLRTADKKPLAREWSTLNRGVRRLERAARPRQ